jgi:hypothetical protein
MAFEARDRVSPDDLPTLQECATQKLLKRLLEAVEPWDLRRAERDLARMRAFISPDEARRHYVKPLESDTTGTVAELFAVASASVAAVSVLPHSPGPGERNFIARIRRRRMIAHLSDSRSR